MVKCKLQCFWSVSVACVVSSATLGTNRRSVNMYWNGFWPACGGGNHRLVLMRQNKTDRPHHLLCTCQCAWKKSGLGSKRVCQAVFIDNLLNQWIRKVRTYILIGFAFVEGGSHFPNVETLECLWCSGLVGCLNHSFYLYDPPSWQNSPSSHFIFFFDISHSHSSDEHKSQSIPKSRIKCQF